MKMATYFQRISEDLGNRPRVVCVLPPMQHEPQALALCSIEQTVRDENGSSQWHISGCSSLLLGTGTAMEPLREFLEKAFKFLSKFAPFLSDCCFDRICEFPMDAQSEIPREHLGIILLDQVVKGTTSCLRGLGEAIGIGLVKSNTSADSQIGLIASRASICNIVIKIEGFLGLCQCCI